MSINVIGQTETDTINVFMDKWHKAAADTDTELFFGSMADSAIYIGTAATERWNKQEFYSFAKPYFDKGKAWDFKPIERAVYFSDDKNFAWFNETLDTWMGVCRGSGVLTRDKSGIWKLAHYHLSVTVPNEKIKEFIKLMAEPGN